MSDKKWSKINRQLLIYYLLLDTDTDYNLSELMRRFDISRSTIERDIKDLKDIGFVHSSKWCPGVFSNKNDAYKDIEYIKTQSTVSNEELEKVAGTKRRLSHLIRLKRLCTLISEFYERIDYCPDYLDEYDEAIESYNSIKADYNSGDPDVTRKDLAKAKAEVATALSEINSHDLKNEYRRLFPDTEERTRQRDFKILNEVCFDIKYVRKLNRYALVTYTNPSENF